MKNIIVVIMLFIISCSTGKNEVLPPFVGTWEIITMGKFNVPYTDPITGLTSICFGYEIFPSNLIKYITFTSDYNFIFYLKDSISTPFQYGKWMENDSGFNLIEMDTLRSNRFINASYKYLISIYTIIISKQEGPCLFKCKCIKSN
jgi:hypothetical protein